jgi:sugar diacid utilization regulator
MQKHDFFMTRSGLKYENFLVDLLEGKFHDVNLVSSRLELLDRKFHNYFCILVFHCHTPHDSKVFHNVQISALHSHFPESMSVVYQDSVVFFLNEKKPILFSEPFLAPIREVASLNHMQVGISQPYQDILKTKVYYQQAVDSVFLGEEYCPKQTLYFSADLMPYALLHNFDSQQLSAGIHYMIYLLDDYDEQYHTEFIATLRAYFLHDRNAAQTAEALHIHRSTLFYRFKKIEELLDISLTDSHLLFLFELSFYILDYFS